MSECKTKNKAYTDNGWTKNHYSWCRSDGVGLFKQEKTGSGPWITVGTLTMGRVMIGVGTRQSRNMEVDVTSYDIRTSGQWAKGVYLDTSVDCAGWPGFGQCDDYFESKYTFVKSYSTQTANITMKSNESGSSGQDKIGTAVFKIWSNVYEEGRIDGVDSPTQGMRCDSAKYTKPAGKGCIFDRVHGVVEFDRGNGKMDQAAKHMYDALNNPQDTYPKFSKKSVPATLHRMAHDSKRMEANHTAAVKVCKSHWGDDYAKGGKDCDEYPFRSTREGAAAGDNRFSARPINLKENRAAGGLLGGWYNSDHILDGDQFKVKIK